MRYLRSLIAEVHHGHHELLIIILIIEEVAAINQHMVHDGYEQ